MDEDVSQEDICTKKLIKFRLGGRAHTMSLFEFARYLGLYMSEELNEEGFEIYFQKGWRDEGASGKESTRAGSVLRNS
jgi:hypothetical protein